jgi:hypothetical protein
MFSPELQFVAPYVLFAIGGEVGLWFLRQHLNLPWWAFGVAGVVWLFVMFVVFLWGLSGGFND